MTEIENFKEAIESLNAQLEASKQMYNESVNNCFQLRTSNVTFQKEIQKLKNELEDVKLKLYIKESGNLPDEMSQ
jgi:chromosome segregation ATPase